MVAHLAGVGKKESSGKEHASPERGTGRQVGCVVIKNCNKDGLFLSLFAMFALFYFGAWLIYLLSRDFVNYHVMAVESLEANHGSDF